MMCLLLDDVLGNAVHGRLAHAANTQRMRAEWSHIHATSRSGTLQNLAN